jgi:hypothetical protein
LASRPHAVYPETMHAAAVKQATNAPCLGTLPPSLVQLNIRSSKSSGHKRKEALSQRQKLDS